MKLIILLISLGIGFGGGVYWGVHHPTEANTLSAAEEKQFLATQLKVSQAIKAKLDSMATKAQASPTGGAKGFISGFAGGGSSSGVNADEVKSLQADQDQQINQLQARLDKLK